MPGLLAGQERVYDVSWAGDTGRVPFVQVAAESQTVVPAREQEVAVPATQLHVSVEAWGGTMVKGEALRAQAAVTVTLVSLLFPPESVHVT